MQRPVFTVFTCPRGPVSGPVITRGRVGVIGSVPACLPAETDERDTYFPRLHLLHASSVIAIDAGMVYRFRVS